MAPKSTGKTKAQDLQRIRQNQQRSRDRKRAYIVELEDEIARLKDVANGRDSVARGPVQAEVENDARRELLKALGINEAAQQQFVDAFKKSKAVQETMPDGVPAKSKEWSVAAQNDSVRKSCHQDCHVRSCVPAPSASSGVARPEPIDDLSPTPSALHSSRDAPESQIPHQTGHGQSLEPGTLWTPCLLKSSLQNGASCSESVTGCSIAFSMLLSNNSRGYSFADIEARLQEAYRKDDSVAEGCSVLNKVLFELLSEIS